VIPGGKYVKVICLVLLLGSSAQQRSLAEEREALQWFAPSEFGPANPDPRQFIQLIRSPSAWEKARKYVRVFEVYTSFVNKVPDEVLRELFAYLADQQIQLALESPILSMISKDQCGWGVEGYGPPQMFRRTAERVKNLGGRLVYVAMDEPLFYGRDFTSKDNRIACHDSIAELARNAARNVAEIRQIFPDVQVGDIEPAEGLPNAEVELPEWFAAFEKATGKRLAFFHADVLFGADFVRAQLDAYKAAGDAHIAFGFIFNGNGAAKSGRAWMQTAFARTQRIHALRLPLQHVVVQDWDMYPEEFLPETSESALTNLILYVNSRSAYQSPAIDLFELTNTDDAARRILTTSVDEVNRRTENGWRRGGVRLIFPAKDSQRDLVPVYRQINMKSGDQLITTTSVEERNDALRRGYGEPRLLGYAYGASDLAGKPLRRAYDVTRKAHFYTFFEEEYLALPRDRWSLEGVAARFPYY